MKDYEKQHEISHECFNEAVFKSLYRLEVGVWTYLHRINMPKSDLISAISYIHSSGVIDVTFKSDYSAFKKNADMSKEFEYLLGNES